MANALDFMINIQQKLSGDNATAKLAALEKQINKERGALADLEKQMAKMQAGPSIDIKDFKGLDGAITSSKGKIASLQEAMGKPTNAAGLAQAEAINGVLLKIAATIAVVIVALGALAAKMTAFALETANAHRSSMLLLNALSGSKAAGEANEAAIDKVAKSTATAREAIEGYAKKLAIAGLQGKLFEDTLRTMAIASSLLGEEAAGHIESILEKSKALGHFEINAKALKGLGISFGDLAKAVGMTEPAFKAAMKAGKITVEQGMDAVNKSIQARFGGDNAALMLDFNVQLLKLKENIAAMFKDINIEPFLKALKDVLSFFDQNTASGKAMHAMIKGAFDAIFEAAAKVGPYVKEFLKGGLIAALELYILFKKLRSAILEAFGGSKGADKMREAMLLGKMAVYGLVGVLVFLGLIFAAVGVMIYNDIAPLIALYDMFEQGEKIFGDFGAQMEQTFSSFSLPDLGQQASDMVDGLVNGITGKIGDVVAAMTSLGTSAMDALNSVFHFGSPSKAMIQRGKWTGEGMEQGVDASSDGVQDAMQGLAAPPPIAKGGAKKKGGGDTYNIVIHATVETAKEIAEALADYLEGKGIEAGVAAEPAT